MRRAARLKALLVAAVFVLSLTAAAHQSPAPPAWTPPPARKAKTPFAPKPHAGHNIFKGEAEVWLADAVEKVEGGDFTPVEDKAVQDYVSQVGDYLASHSTAPDRRYEFVVTDDWSPDAMTAGGGRIYVSLGMLERVESEDELAGVLAHEIAHDAFGHAAKTVTRQLFWMTGEKKVETPAEVEAALTKLLEEYEKKPLSAVGESLLGFARFDELEADRAAFYNTYKAGYNPHALADVIKRMAREEKIEMGKDEYNWYQLLVLLFGSHPPSKQRTMALSWEALFVKMPAKDSHHASAAFDAMKARVAEMANKK